MVTDILPLVLLLLLLWIVYRQGKNKESEDDKNALLGKIDETAVSIALIKERLNEVQVNQQDAMSRLREEIQKIFAEQNTRFEQRQTDALKHQMEAMQNGMTNIQKQVGEYLARNSDEIGKRMGDLTLKTDKRLQEISGQVEKRLAEGFEKTTATFSDIVKRLALIDEAQKKITELSSSVVSLQEILADKRSRGAFGEVQLHSLVHNVLAEADYALQYTLPNSKIADCVLFLPEPTGMVAIDSKFPLESYRRLSDFAASEIERKAAEKQFKQDIQKHINDISEKYIIPGTTSDGAIMFIPAEAVFAEIQAHHGDLVDKAHAARVWMVSPTTLWATPEYGACCIKGCRH